MAHTSIIARCLARFHRAAAYTIKRTIPLFVTSFSEQHALNAWLGFKDDDAMRVALESAKYAAASKARD